MKHTYREYTLWLEWLDNQFNEPSRTDYYLMQIAEYVASKFSKKAWKLSDFKLAFRIRGEVSEEEKKQRALQSKAAWGALLSAPPAKKTVSVHAREGWPSGNKS